MSKSNRYATLTHGITELLNRMSAGDSAAEAQLLDLVYDDLRRLAAHYMKNERPEHTLQPTAIVHELFIRLVDQNSVQWKNRAQFFVVAATLMRRILVDCARDHFAKKGPGHHGRIPLETAVEFFREQVGDLIALDEALHRLAKLDSRQSMIVELRFFGGLSVDETAQHLNISARQVRRDWTIARAWLHGQLKGAQTHDGGAMESDQTDI